MSIVMFYTNGTEIISEREMEDRYRDMLNDCYDEVRIGDLTYMPSDVLEHVDPIAFRCGLVDYIDAEGFDETDEIPDTDEYKYLRDLKPQG